MSGKSIYPGGIKAVLDQYEARRDSFTYAPGETLPSPDIDLAALRSQIVGDPDQDPKETGPFRSSYHRKRFQLRQELTGQSELCFLNGLLISHLRKRSPDASLVQLFQRLWSEESAHLLAHLNPRWLVSAITTFGDHGASDTQRSVGQSMTVLFGMMKLYESERLFSGTAPDTPFPARQRLSAPLPLDMDSYSIGSGGLDVNLIARLWQDAVDDPVIMPLAHHLLTLLIEENGSVFARFAILRGEKRGQKADKDRNTNPAPVPLSATAQSAQDLRWGIVSTIRAPLRQIARFAAHHLELGADALHIYLDIPDSEAEAFLTRHPKIQVTQCDDSYWQSTGKTRMDEHQLRQLFNATRCLRANADDLDWLAHIDVDEFILTQTEIPALLAATPDEDAVLRLYPVEALARDDGLPHHFKRAPSHTGQPSSVLQDIYPTFGMHLPGGFLSHVSGKNFVRTGIEDTRLGIHALKYKGKDATNRSTATEAVLAHLHAPSWAHFQSHLSFRRARGSYQPKSNRKTLSPDELFSMLEEEGPEMMRSFFDEVCADTPELCDRLTQHGMLHSHKLDLDAAIQRVFGTLP